MLGRNWRRRIYLPTTWLLAESRFWWSQDIFLLDTSSEVQYHV